MRGREVCERVSSSVYMQRCVVAHMRKAAEGYLCFLIFFAVFDMLSWSSRSRSWIISQMDTSDLLNKKKKFYHCLSHTRGKACHCSSTVFTTLQCHLHKNEKKKAVVENLDLMQISFAPHYQANKTIALALTAEAHKDTQLTHVVCRLPVNCHFFIRCMRFI